MNVKTLLAGFALVALGYLAISFAQLSFDPTKWGIHIRTLFSIVALLLLTYCFVMSIDEDYN